MAKNLDKTGRRMIERSLQGMSPENRATTESILLTKANTCKRSTVIQYARYAGYLDAHVNGRPFRTATPDDIAGFLGSMQARYANQTTVGASRYAKAILNHVLGDARSPRPATPFVHDRGTRATPRCRRRPSIRPSWRLAGDPPRFTKKLIRAQRKRAKEAANPSGSACVPHNIRAAFSGRPRCVWARPRCVCGT